MNEALDRIHQWAVAEDINRAIVTDALGNSTAADTAIRGIQTERAQLVVDTLAQELADRKQRLLGAKEELIVQLAGVETELAEFDANVNSATTLVNYLEIVPTVLRSEFLAATEKLPPFTLEIPTREGYPGQLSLVDWVKDRTDKLKDLYGDSSQVSFTRAANVLLRNWWSPVVLNTLRDRSVISEHEPIEQDGQVIGQRLIVNSPAAFLRGASGLTNMGQKSALALVCIADVQALERAEQAATASVEQ